MLNNSFNFVFKLAEMFAILRNMKLRGRLRRNRYLAGLSGEVLRQHARSIVEIIWIAEVYSLAIALCLLGGDDGNRTRVISLED